MPAGRCTKLAAGSGFAAARSTFSPAPTANLPEITVTNSSLEWRCGGTVKPLGNLRRSTNGPSLAGLPSRTAAWAPLGSDGGAGPQLTASPATTVWWASSAKTVAAPGIDPSDANSKHAVAMDWFCMTRAPLTARRPRTGCERLPEVMAGTWMRTWEAAWKWAWKRQRRGAPVAAGQVRHGQRHRRDRGGRAFAARACRPGGAVRRPRPAAPRPGAAAW